MGACVSIGTAGRTELGGRDLFRKIIGLSSASSQQRGRIHIRRGVSDH